MHLKKHVMYICLGLLILGLIYFLALSDIFHPKQVASYENFTEISEEYDATEEINKATETYAKSANMARIVKGTPGTDKKVIYLTFNGMESRGNKASSKRCFSMASMEPFLSKAPMRLMKKR